MTTGPRLDRRRFLTVLSGSALGVAVLGSACTDGGASPFAWERVELANVSAYVLLRGGEAAVVDTGTAGSADAIEQVLAGLGLDWGAVGDVILTHRHADHVGSLPAVAERATDATLSAGTADVPVIDVDGVVAVDDGDVVFGELVVIATPGHTPGHIALHHRATRLLVAGDALIGDNGTVAGPVARYTDDMDTALASVGRLAELDVDAVLFGHGDPVLGDAGAQIAALVSDG